jgi:hypothetical protein
MNMLDIVLDNLWWKVYGAAIELVLVGICELLHSKVATSIEWKSSNEFRYSDSLTAWVWILILNGENWS